MPPRRNAEYMQQVDERVLEYLSTEPWATASEMAETRGFEVPEGTIQERCRVLADIEFVAPVVEERDPTMWEITTWGQLYLEGEVDAQYREPTKRALRG